MLVSFKFKNFRSYAEEAELSFVAQPGDVESDGVKTVTLKDGSKVSLLTVASVFGANASGKSNIIHALSALSGMVARSLEYKVSDGLPGWIPYFSPKKNEEPIEATLDFIVDGERYLYSVKISFNGVVDERLQLYLKGKPEIVFSRKLEELDKADRSKPGKLAIALGPGWLSTTLDISGMNLLGNQLMLSWLATKEANGLQHVSEYIGSLPVLTPDAMPASTGQQLNVIAEKIFRLKETDGKSPIFHRFSKVMQIADLGVSDVYMAYHDDSDFQFPPSVSGEMQKAIINDNRWEFNLIHKMGDGSGNSVKLPLSLESQGTQALVKMVPYLLKALDEGSFLAYDEISTAIHPALLRLLINLFQSPKSNPNGAQLLFTTHDATIVDNDTLRADQIWFAEKKDGKSELYSAQDFEGVSIRHTPFEKWYRAGRFGALPAFGNIDYIFEADVKEAEE